MNKKGYAEYLDDEMTGGATIDEVLTEEEWNQANLSINIEPTDEYTINVTRFKVVGRNKAIDVQNTLANLGLHSIITKKE